MIKFMGLMNSSWVLDGHDVVRAFDLSRFQRIVDLGGKKPLAAASRPSTHENRLCSLKPRTGCTGALAHEVAKAYPSSSVVVFDLPGVVEAAQKHFPQENDAVAFESGERLCRTRPS